MSEAVSGTSYVPVPLAEILAVVHDYEQSGQIETAARLVGHVLAVTPNRPEVLHLAGIIAHHGGDPARALALIERAIALGSDLPLYLRNISEVYRTLGRLDDAIAAARRAANLAPFDPLCLHNQSIIHYHRLELDEALACAKGALALAPNLAGAHFGQAEVLLLRGDWAEGWEEYEWRFRTAGAVPVIPPDLARADVSQWDGKHLDEARLGGRTLLLVADQGFGDVIQFSRYIPWAEALCPDLAIAASPEVALILRQIAPRARLSTQWADCPTYAAYCPLSGLPRLHGTRPDTVPASVPYLRARPLHATRWAERLEALVPRGMRRIGLVWAGRPTHSNDRNRSAGLSDFKPLADLADTALLTLQKGPRIGDAGRYFGRAPLLNLGAEIADYDDTMGVLANLDIIVTVDTSVAHLAGAMGRPTCILLPRAPDWRWLLDQEYTPWYPSARLFRRDLGESWADVVTRVAMVVGKGGVPPACSD